MDTSVPEEVLLDEDAEAAKHSFYVVRSSAPLRCFHLSHDITEGTNLCSQLWLEILKSSKICSRKHLICSCV